MEPVLETELIEIPPVEFRPDPPVSLLPVEVLEVWKGEPATTDDLDHYLDDLRRHPAKFAV